MLATQELPESGLVNPCAVGAAVAVGGFLSVGKVRRERR